MTLQKGGDELSQRLASHDDHLSYLFTLLTHDKTFITACQFLEDLLQARKSVLNLNTIRECLHLSTYGLRFFKMGQVLKLQIIIRTA